MKKLMQKVRNESGFTLIELLGVGVILTIMAMVAVPTVLGSINQARVNTTKDSALQMASALERFKAAQISMTSATGNYPIASGTSKAAVEGANAGTDAGSFIALIGTDYWQRPANPNYDFVSYESDATGSKFVLCLKAKDSKTKIVRVNSTGAQPQEGLPADEATLCVLP